ncbi:FAD-dependent monooxygenase [Actinoplanes sp. NPDC004185]
MTDTETDFCIVGAGPAGCTLSLLLLRSGCRVTLVEKSRSLVRAYRGEILQPGGMRLLDDLGVLGPARERGSHEHDRFQLVDRDRVIVDGDYRGLPGPFNFLLSIPQQHVLEELLAQCRRYPGFSYLPGTKIVDLIRDDDRVTGAVVRGDGGSLAIRAHCVVAADGRYSKTRQLAGIRNRRLDVFAHDVLWLRVPADGEQTRSVRIFRAGGNPVLTYACVPDAIQLGWTLPHRAYRAIADRGIEYVKDQIKLAAPPYADRVAAGIRSLRDLTLLDVFAARAEEWVRDGLVLIGDSAHTQSPIGAQGINLAIQDAVALHPVLIGSWHDNDAGRARLAEFASRRGRDIDRMMRIQVMQSKAMLSTGRVASFVRPRVARVVSRTPLYRKVFREIAFGNDDIRIGTDARRAVPHLE